MQIGVQLKQDFGDSIINRMELIRRAGGNIIEIDGEELRKNSEAIKTYAKDTGIIVASVCGGYRGWIGHFDSDLRKQSIEDIQSILHKCSEVGASGIVLPAAYGMFSTRLNAKTAPRSSKQDHEILLDSLAQLDRHAQDTGSYIYLEPLNRYEDHMLNTLAQVGTLIKEGAFTHVKITADTFHMNIEEPSVEGSLTHWSPFIGHVHLADTNRLQPGKGHFPFASFFKTLRTVGYSGNMVIESSWQGDLETSIRQCLDFLAKQYDVNADEEVRSFIGANQA